MLLVTSLALSQTYYIAPTGDDDSGDGSIENPWATFLKAETMLYAGDTLIVRGGTYNEWVFLETRGGTATEPIVIKRYPGETPIIDGTDTTIAASYGLLDLYRSYFHVTGLTIRNSDQSGVRMGNTGNWVDSLTVHNIMGTGIAAYGDSSKVEDCLVYDVAMENEDGAKEGIGTWGAGITAARGGASGDDTTDYAIIRRNIVHDCWGEGISSYEASNTIIADNVIYDAYSVMLYISDSKYVYCSGNLVYTTKDLAGIDRYVGLAISDEKAWPNRCDTVVNNVVMGCYINLYMSGYPQENTLVANNVFMNSTYSEGCVVVRGDAGAYTNVRFANNIIIQENSDSVIAFNYPTGQEIIFSHNLWSKAPNSNASGTGDVIGDPLLTEDGDTTAGNLTLQHFRLQATSPAINAGLNVGLSYSGVAPDMGAIEYTTPISYFNKRLGKRN